MHTHTPPQAEEAALRAAFAVAHISAQRRAAQARMTAAIIFSILNLLERWYAAWQKTRDAASHPANETDAPLAAPHWESVLRLPLAASRLAGTPCAIRLAAFRLAAIRPTVAVRPARAPPCTGPDRPRRAPRQGPAPTPVFRHEPPSTATARKTPPLGGAVARAFRFDYETTTGPAAPRPPNRRPATAPA